MKNFLLLTFLFSSLVQAQVPAELQNVRLEDKRGALVNLDLHFKNEKGEAVQLKNYFDGKRPVVLLLAYYECKSLCTQVLNGSLEAFKKLNWQVGEQYQVLTVSIDPREGPELASEKKESYLKELNHPGAKEGWHFLVGDGEAIQTLAGEVGFFYQYDKESDQYAHPAAMFVLSPEGKLSRVFSGFQFEPRDLRFSLVEASQGKIGNAVDRLLLTCYRFDPKQNRYILMASNAMKAGGAATILFLGFLIFRSGKNKKRDLI